ncbi:MAG TPA: hypothetical protein VNA16_02370, partial [Abditibacteriaceae bacterium]|nr:hypothetical protein [Abditibacteriaceae bacterium]
AGHFDAGHEAIYHRCNGCWPPTAPPSSGHGARGAALAQFLERGCRLLWQPHHELRAGIVSLQPPSGDAAVLYQQLEENFALSLRQGKSGASWIRAAPHFMNTERDMEQLAAAVECQCGTTYAGNLVDRKI